MKKGVMLYLDYGVYREFKQFWGNQTSEKITTYMKNNLHQKRSTTEIPPCECGTAKITNRVDGDRYNSRISAATGKPARYPNVLHKKCIMCSQETIYRMDDVLLLVLPPTKKVLAEPSPNEERPGPTDGGDTQ